MGVIKEHQQEVKLCYEQELQKVLTLAGKLAVTFIIGPTGEVVDAKTAEVPSGFSQVNECLVKRLRRWKFPPPIGGGSVTVTFPWIFKPAGGNADE